MKEMVNQDNSKIGVYRIMTPSGRIYIGMTTVSFKERWYQHHKSLRSRKHRCKGLQHAYDKYGWERFKIEILETFEKPVNKDLFNDLANTILYREKLLWIKHKNSGFSMLNDCPSGNGSVFHSEETKRKIAAAAIINNKRKINKRVVFSDAEIELIKNDYESGMLIKDLVVKYDKNIKKLYQLIQTNNFTRPQIEEYKSFKKFLNDYPIIDWHFNEGKSAIEISKIVGCSNSYISSILRYAMQENPNLDNSIAKDNTKLNAANGVRNVKKVKCTYCPREISVRNIKRHENVCGKK